MERVIFLIPTKVDEKGVIYIKPMLKEEISENHRRRLVKMGLFPAKAFGMNDD